MPKKKWKLILESLVEEFANETPEEKAKLLKGVERNFFDPSADLALVEAAADLACNEECDSCEEWNSGDACMGLRRGYEIVISKMIDIDIMVRKLARAMSGKEVDFEELEDEDNIVVDGKPPERIEGDKKDYIT